MFGIPSKDNKLGCHQSQYNNPICMQLLAPYLIDYCGNVLYPLLVAIFIVEKQISSKPAIPNPLTSPLYNVTLICCIVNCFLICCIPCNGSNGGGQVVVFLTYRENVEQRRQDTHRKIQKTTFWGHTVTLVSFIPIHK